MLIICINCHTVTYNHVRHQYIKGKKDIVAEKRLRISHAIAEKMLLSSKREGDYLKALKWALTGTDVLAVSANGKNGDLIQILNCFDPIFATKDVLEAGYFTAKLFPDVEVLIDEDPFPDEEVEACGLANLVNKFSEALQDENTDTATAQDRKKSNAVITQDENADISTVTEQDTNDENKCNENDDDDENGNDYEAATRINQADKADSQLELEKEDS